MDAGTGDFGNVVVEGQGGGSLAGEKGEDLGAGEGDGGVDEGGGGAVFEIGAKGVTGLGGSSEADS